MQNPICVNTQAFSLTFMTAVQRNSPINNTHFVSCDLCLSLSRTSRTIEHGESKHKKSHVSENCDWICSDMWPKLIAFGNVLLDFTYCTTKYPEIVSEYGFDPNGLGECSSETLDSVRENANKR